MTIAPSPYEIIRAIQDQQRATDRLVAMLIGMLDKSAPDPFLSAAPLQEGEVRPAPMPPRSRRIGEENGRPPVIVKLHGVEVKTTKRRASLLSAVMEAPLTLSAMSRQGIAPTVAGVKAQIIDTNRDLDRAGLDLRVRMQAQPAQRRGARGGREPALYALLGPKDHEIAGPDTSPQAPLDPAPAADDENLPAKASEPIPDVEGNSTASLEDGHVDRGASAQPHSAEGGPAHLFKAGEAGTGQASSTETESHTRQPFGAGTGSAVRAGAPSSKLRSVSPPRAAEATPPAGVKRPPAAQPAEAPRPKPKTAPAKAAARIEPGDLIAVDIKQRRIQTTRGVYEVGGANLARALDKLRGGHLFGLDVIAKVAGWPSPDVARTALGFERKRLADHGVDLFLDKFNVRLREAS